MNKEKFCDAEERRLNWLINFRLPNYFKQIGWWLFFISLFSIFATTLFDGDFNIIKTVLKNVMLLSLLIVILSKEKIEDELIGNMRSRAFSFSFIIGVIYVLVQPLFNYAAFLLVKPEKAIFTDLGDFQILWFLLVVYLGTFWFLKKRN